MLAIILALSARTGRHVAELGALLGLIGGLALAGGFLPSFRRFSPIVAGVLLAVGFALIIYAYHYGAAL
jgi:hypothetical protein